ncbi:MAG: transposase [Thermodesulfobacteriota bacterium]
MPRIARAVAPGYPHHVTQRGNYQQNIFKDEEDYRQYKSWLEAYSRREGLRIWAYCLMTNHVHFVCVPDRETSLSRTFNTLHMRYSQYFNKKQGVKGHLWQGRFFSSILDEKHLFAAVRYVENNPLRANMVKDAEEYRWSSARGHIESGIDPVLSYDSPLDVDIRDWRRYLREADDGKLVEEILKNVLTGRPCGDEGFIARIEDILGRELKANPRGRPWPRKGAT